MPGTGTKTADTKAEPPARCLDLTRLVGRAGKQHTGVDRVEMAYLTHLLAADAPLFGLVRTSLGYLLLDQTGCAAFRNRLARGDIGRPTLFSLLARRSDRARAGAESDLRRDAIGRARTHKLGDMLLRHLPRGASYINVGHTNLSRATVQGLRAVPGMRIAVMIHDTIPLDLPDMQRAGSVARFQTFFDRAMADADVIIANSHATAADVARHCDHPPEICVAPLGIDPPKPGTAPRGSWTGQPYFVALGTIEPRKNHAFLLDLWDELVATQGPEAPHLVIVGARGWRNKDVFARLDAGPPNVHELAGQDDEGFGLPPAEAVQLGTPVVCNTLEVLRETLGDNAIYADVADRYLWRDTILRLARGQDGAQSEMANQSAEWHPPDWPSHFNTLLSRI